MTDKSSEKKSSLLQIRGLRIEARTEQGTTEIVRGVDLDLAPGEILGLIGESGAGKSTIGLAAMGFARDGCRITAGEVIFKGRDILKLSESERCGIRGSQIAYVAQSPAASFNPAHRLMNQCTEVPVRHNIMSREEAEKTAKELFRITQLPDPEHIGDRFPHQVSGGQLQRVMSAMAMVCHPALIVLDEPTTALDVTTQVEVLAVIRDLVKRFNTSAIHITHDIAVVAQLANRIMVLRHGKLVEEGPTEQLLSNAKEQYTRDLLQVNRVATKPVAPPAETQRPLLETRKVNVSYGNFKALIDFDLHVPRGHTVAIVGESGSGKSTAARAISGLRAPVSGQVLWGGEEMPPLYTQRSKDELRRIQLIYQTPDTAINPRQKVREILGRPLQFYLGLSGKKQEDRIRELLRMVDLDPDQFIDRYPGAMSGGQKQRICIARALAADPQLLICDEVTSALDPLIAEGILNLLLRLQRELSLTYLVITHDISVVRAIADDVYVMHHGRVVETGTTAQVLSAPREDYTKRLLAAAPELRTDWLDNILAKRLRMTDGAAA
ncbi:MAG: ABC transporter ATP-binding protein [Pseudorhodoplanes sp.]